MVHRMAGDGRRKRAGVCLWALLFLVAILPRSAGAFVLHSHEGHGLHVHLVSGLEDHAPGVGRDAFHARHHAHAHGGDPRAPDGAHPGGEAEIFLGLPSEPVRAPSLIPLVLPPLERSAEFLAVRGVERIAPPVAEGDRSRPPRPRGRALRSGTRALLWTSPALRL